MGSYLAKSFKFQIIISVISGQSTGRKMRIYDGKQAVCVFPADAASQNEESSAIARAIMILWGRAENARVRRVRVLLVVMDV